MKLTQQLAQNASKARQEALSTNLKIRVANAQATEQMKALLKATGYEG